jgi:hypothetical protein
MFELQQLQQLALSLALPSKLLQLLKRLLQLLQSLPAPAH